MPKVLVILRGSLAVIDGGVAVKGVAAKKHTGETAIINQTVLTNNMQTVLGMQAFDNQNWTVELCHQLSRANPIRVIIDGFRFRKMVRAEEYDLVHQFWGGFASWINAWFSPVPFVISLLGSDFYGAYDNNGKQTIKGKLLSFFSKLTLRKADGVIVMSARMANDIGNGAKMLAVIPEGVKSELFYPIEMSEARQQLGLQTNMKYILYFNNGSKVKNPQLARDTVAILNKKYPEYKLLELANIPHTELVKYYNAVNVLLITSLHEGSNNSIKEALACGCPVVSTDVGDAAERLKNVFPSKVVPSFMPKDFVSAIKEIVDDANRSNGPQYFSEFALSTMVERIFSFYGQVVNANQSKSRPQG